ncbi:SMI1/KNR4 family protein [Bartonella harrusi]|uniref:SMI1/KNR4 family protein n=1 Tax=Bartonella harrusi TaxID=2961895 RepID=A0ABY5EVI9_9HYPH|nr:SMI1/KNR4 family protein [Bartonella harrusi]UTO29154.1 SMI1/KNR4 family protein [Bartonella harrusi]
MKTYTLDDVRELVDKYEGDIVNFASKDKEADELMIEKAEKALGLQFTTSYKAFLKYYKGGDIGGEDIYSLYEDCAPTSDFSIVFQNLNDRKRGFVTPEQLVVCDADFGETFYFDYTQFRDGECPLYVMFADEECEYYASNFYEFLCKRIKVHAGEDIEQVYVGDETGHEKTEQTPPPQPLPFYKRFWKKLWRRDNS